MTPFIVAEMSASHMGSLERAFAIIDAAARSGAQAVKLQTWATMTVSDRLIEDGPWTGKRIEQLYRECVTPWGWHGDLFKRCSERGIACFSTPFDRPSVDFLELLNCPTYKIASFEITDLRLIRYAASTGKPLMISTGMARVDEIEAAVHAATTSGAGGITLLKCVSAYPAPENEYNLASMRDMATRFECDQIGLSDHTRRSAVAVAATLMGAQVIEKHLSLDRQGPDGGFALIPREFADFVRDVRAACDCIGTVRYGPTSAELENLQFRRSIWVQQDCREGDVISEENVGIYRPQGGLAPDMLDVVLGKHFTRDVRHGEPLTDFI